MKHPTIEGCQSVFLLPVRGVNLSSLSLCSVSQMYDIFRSHGAAGRGKTDLHPPTGRKKNDLDPMTGRKKNDLDPTTGRKKTD